ncbi:phosphoribosylanthranilate isomerase [Aurantiacibacter suaedae]|uniref:phosphoribosylanthranilate isomerase n=1 Tax=Aurantiacibacter suaedae TaxID=2545755 RepID=UPI0010F4AE18|nr:phosphoribosylanthranilate isomerase [Aurantiacibacter suaedae]
MAPPLIKICGLSTPETLDAAVAAGATHVGFVHFKPSPRHLSIAHAADLRERVPAHVKAVLLTVNMEPAQTSDVLQAVRPDVLQLHGQETPDWLQLMREHSDLEIWKAVSVKHEASLEQAQRYKPFAHRLLYDAAGGVLPGGNGLAFDWRLLANYRHELEWGLAGGLNASNVGDAIAQTRAPLVDASSGVESAPGVKDPDKIAAFCEAARVAMAALPG